LKIRRYANEDWTRICEIHDAARKDELSAAGLGDAFLTMEQTAANEGFHDYDILVAEADCVVQGFVAFNETELSWLYVDPGVYRRGIGLALVKAVLLATDGPMSVEVLHGNEKALSLYTKAGFVVERQASGRMPGNERFAVSVTELRYGSAALPVVAPDSRQGASPRPDMSDREHS
jgi:ribosomal protein S18 acetylase RimI-like enzyme